MPSDESRFSEAVVEQSLALHPNSTEQAQHKKNSVYIIRGESQSQPSPHHFLGQLSHMWSLSHPELELAFVCGRELGNQSTWGRFQVLPMVYPFPNPGILHAGMQQEARQTNCFVEH